MCPFIAVFHAVQRLLENRFNNWEDDLIKKTVSRELKQDFEEPQEYFQALYTSQGKYPIGEKTFWKNKKLGHLDHLIF